MKKQGSGQRLFKICQGSESIKHTIIKRLNRVCVQVCVEEMIDEVEENERRKMKEGGQGMEVIEKTRWEGDKTVGVERMRTRMKRGMNEMKRV